MNLWIETGLIMSEFLNQVSLFNISYIHTMLLIIYDSNQSYSLWHLVVLKSDETVFFYEYKALKATEEHY